MKISYTKSKVIFLSILLISTFAVNASQDNEKNAIPVADYTGMHDSKTFWEEIERLNQQKEYDIASKQIEMLLQSRYSLKNLELAVKNSERHFEQLHKNNTIFKKSVFNRPEEKMSSKISKVGGLVSLLSGNILSIIPAGASLYHMHRTDKKNYDEAMVQKFSFEDKDKANATLQQYDILKKNLQIYINLLTTKYPVTGNSNDKQAYLLLKHRCETLKKNIIAYRCNYVSYHVVSPRMAEVSKQLYLATFKWLGLDDKQKIKESVLYLARSCHYNWLYTSSEDVRIQFCEVVKEMKDNIGKAEWEEFKVLTSMLDSSDPSKKRGADAWWEEK